MIDLFIGILPFLAMSFLLFFISTRMSMSTKSETLIQPKYKTVILESGLGSGLEEKVESVINEVGYENIKIIEYSPIKYWYGSEKSAIIIYLNPLFKE